MKEIATEGAVFVVFHDGSPLARKSTRLGPRAVEWAKSQASTSDFM